MPINHSVQKVTALLLAGGALAVATDAGVQALAGSGAAQASATTAIHGNANALPAILSRAARSDLAAIRSDEASERRARLYHLPAGARYDSAVFDVFAQQGGGGS